MVGDEKDFQQFTVEDIRFHILIAEGSGNFLILKVNNVLRNLLEYHQKKLYKKLGPSGGIKEHKTILEAIKNRDSELSAIYARQHLKRNIRCYTTIGEVI
jgi:GntR family transcriptional regulator, transcriptional repressor for pyruvate dehydrogenase complex